MLNQLLEIDIRIYLFQHSSTFVHPHFLTFLSTLGWPVNVWRHPGWTGHISTSWKGGMTEPREATQCNDHGGALFNGDNHVIYWADALSELAFVVPSRRRSRSPLRRSDDDAIPKKSSCSSAQGSCGNMSATSLTLDLASSQPSQGQGRSVSAAACPTGSAAPPEATKRRFHRQASTAPQAEVKMIIVWLERMEDSLHIPLDELLIETMVGTEPGGFAPCQKDAFVIFIQPMKSGLVLIRMQGQTAK